MAPGIDRALSAVKVIQAPITASTAAPVSVQRTMTSPCAQPCAGPRIERRARSGAAASDTPRSVLTRRGEPRRVGAARARSGRNFRGWAFAASGAMAGTLMAGLLTACSPIIRDAQFVGARTRVTDATLAGPFDGQVVDEATDEPIQGATIVAVWSYDRGDGLVGPYGSETREVKTDQAGRYRVATAPRQIRGRTVRLVSFSLSVYKRGYVAYRSDTRFEGGPRTDFSLRHNAVKLRKWRKGDSHAQHLVFLAAPPAVQQRAKWEREAANLDLYRTLGGQAAVPLEAPEPDFTATLQLLDATAVLPPEEIRRRTGYTDAFTPGELGDLARTHFYHGVHLRASDREEAWDVAYRVWKDPPGGMDSVRDTFRATLPDVEMTGDVTNETWVQDDDKVRAVAFIDNDARVGVLLTCGAMQCVDIETAIILARFIADNLEAVQLKDAPVASKPVIPASVPRLAAPRGGSQ